MINPSGSHITHFTAGERFVSLPGRLLATTSALVITLALFLLPATDAVAAPTLSVVYQSSSTLNKAGWTEESGTGGSSCLSFFLGTCVPRGGADLTLPQFNPALGTLESVQFTGSISLSGDVQTSCGGNFFCNTNASLFLEGTINLNDVTTSSGQRINNFGPNLSLEISRSVTCNPVPFGSSCASGSADSGPFGSLTGGARTFSGTSSVAPFIGTGQILFPWSQSSNQLSYEWGLEQSDNPDNVLSGILGHGGGAGVAEAGFCEGAISCVIELGLNGWEAAAHSELLTGCCYGLGAVDIGRDVLIVYTYQPASTSVPEPSTLALLSVAVTPLAIACARRRRRATTDAASARPARPS